MLAWLNFGIILSMSFLFLYFYVKSVRPAALEQQIGEAAYRRCGWYRAIAMLFEFVVAVTYVGFVFDPLPIPLPITFPWAWWISLVIAVGIGIPSGYVMGKGMIDAGKETMAPQKDQQLYGGIYKRIRLSQTLGEVFFWWVIAFLLHSPFLALYSFIFLPIFLFYVPSRGKRFGHSFWGSL